MKAILTSLAVVMFGLASVSLADDQAKATPYPLKTCIVSGEKLGEMGDAFVFTYEGQEIKLCCMGCKKKFDKNPEKFLKEIQIAAKKGG